jgi:methyltransferase family protein
MEVSPKDTARRLDILRRLGSVEPETYAANRLGTLVRDEWVRREVLTRITSGWDPFTAIDDVSHRTARHLFESLLEGVGPAGRILDFGCGEGSLQNFQLDYGSIANPVVAVDAVQPRAQFPSHVHFVRSDLHAFEWSGPPFDLGLSLHVFDLVPDTPRLAARFRGLLRSGARAMLAIPDGRWVHHLVKYITKGDGCDERNVYTLQSFDELMHAAGFELEQWTCWPSYFSIHFEHVKLSTGGSLGQLLDRLAADFDRANGTQSFSCYGYGLTYRAV